MQKSDGSEHSRGTDYEMSVPFGRTPAGALLRVLADVMPIGSAIELITPIGKQVDEFLKQFGKATKPGFLKAKVWSITHSGPEGSLVQLAKLAEECAITELAVWCSAVGPDGSTLLEAEDGNTVLFLSDALPPDSIAAVLRAVGVHNSGVPSAALRRSRVRGLTSA